ncbi:MAG TPA: VOC family protein [Gemmataceae bacterium]|jgi:predicted enzyme related to lactoylglutathione lyase|nr:VOC family protein [Gemmataceae bacterium]
MKQLNGVFLISGEDLTALPVKEIGPAVDFYQSVLGFTAVARDEATATLQRDDARLGLVQKADHRPGEADSCCFTVTDLDAMHRELADRGLDLGEIRTDEWGGKRYQVFFLREAENGYCYCFSQPTCGRSQGSIVAANNHPTGAYRPPARSMNVPVA